MLLRNVISNLKPKQHSSVACCAGRHMGIFLGEAVFMAALKKRDRITLLVLKELILRHKSITCDVLC